MTKLRTLVVCAVLALCGLAAESRAAALIIVGGELRGATGVNVDGTFYNVEFLDGTCEALFDGCDNAADDFAFTNDAVAAAAAHALLVQVFLDIDTATGMFDSNPGATRGCRAGTLACVFFIPFETAGSEVTLIYFINDELEAGDSTVFQSEVCPTGATSHPFCEGRAWAVFTAASEPATMALFGVGLTGMAIARRRRTGGKHRLR